MTRHFRKFLAVAFFVSAFFIVGLLPVLAHASEEPGMAIEDLPPAPSGIALEQGVNFYRAKVLAILSEGKKPIDGVPMDYQEVRLEILNGDEQGKTVVVDHGGPFAIEEYQRVRVGETVILAKPTSSLKPDFYYITDKYRTPRMVWVIVFFVALAVFFGRKRGVTSLLGMLFSVAIIFLFIIPRILAGGDPFLISLVGSLVILVISLYLSHGFNRRTSIALLSTLAALGLAAILDLAFVFLTRLHGIGTEEAFYLQFGSVNLNLRGLLLGG
ncbi:MAG: YibE/F family protein, partial [Parcubacteria group bacterium GW2011_GWC2_45_7]